MIAVFRSRLQISPFHDFWKLLHFTFAPKGDQSLSYLPTQGFRPAATFLRHSRGCPPQASLMGSAQRPWSKVRSI